MNISRVLIIIKPPIYFTKFWTTIFGHYLNNNSCFSAHRDEWNASKAFDIAREQSSYYLWLHFLLNQWAYLNFLKNECKIYSQSHSLWGWKNLAFLVFTGLSAFIDMILLIPFDTLRNVGSQSVVIPFSGFNIILLKGDEDLLLILYSLNVHVKT